MYEVWVPYDLEDSLLILDRTNTTCQQVCPNCISNKQHSHEKMNYEVDVLKHYDILCSFNHLGFDLVRIYKVYSDAFKDLDGCEFDFLNLVQNVKRRIWKQIELDVKTPKLSERQKRKQFMRDDFED